MSWPTEKLESLCSRVTSGGTPSRTNPDFYVREGIPWVKTQELTDNWVWHTSEHISEDAMLTSSAKLLPESTVLIAMYGATAGKLGLLAAEMACNQACCALVADPRKSDPRYLFYAILNSRDELKNLANGAAQQNLSGRLIKQFRVPAPPVSIQRAIAGVLGVLDDKIAANERVANAALNVARALYEEASLRDGESAELGEMVALKYGKALREPDRRPGPVPVYGCTGQVGWHDSSLTSSAGPVVGRKGANAGWISWSPRSSWIIDTAFFAETLREYLSPELAFLMLETAHLPGLVGDSAVPGLNRDTAHRHLVKVPSPLIAQELSERVRPLIRRSTQTQEETHTLAALRDTLLPQLMSGKLRVRDAEKIVEGAV
ncbi:restriction endonuclease subunit S [Streptomyces sp. NPDC050988]|uniref:restriction endonuclease subunit S n=1 Tax=Streptomyces sp. NPDC050988 TaxID=3365637 RepID=UPI00378C1F73